MNAAYRALWAYVEATARAMHTNHCGPYAWGEDDAGMIDAAADDLIEWADDCEARLGCNVGSFRAALLAFMAYRDNGAGLSESDYADAMIDAHELMDDETAQALIVDRMEYRRDCCVSVAARTGDWSDVSAWESAIACAEGNA